MTEAPAAVVAVLTKHLPYELKMFEACFLRLHDEKFAPLREDTVVKNALVEAFLLHARNLIEFLSNQGKDKGSFKSAVSPRDLAEGYYYDAKLLPIYDEIDRQVSHLQYGHDPSEKLDGFTMLRVKQTIDAEIKKFQDHLNRNYRAFWKQRTRGGSKATNETSATDAIAMVSWKG
jgi:hypothetical protein